MWMARVSVVCMSRRRCRRVLNLHNDLTRVSWSTSCRAPRPRSRLAAAPPSSNTGDSASCAFCSAVTVLVTPRHTDRQTDRHVANDRRTHHAMCVATVDINGNAAATTTTCIAHTTSTPTTTCTTTTRCTAHTATAGVRLCHKQDIGMAH